MGVLFWLLSIDGCPLLALISFWLLRSIAIANGAVAMHPFAVRTTPTTTVGVDAGVVALGLRLARLAVHLDVIHLHIPVGGIVGEDNGDPTAQAGGSRMVLHACG